MTTQTDQNRFIITHLCMNTACTMSVCLCLSSYPSAVRHNNNPQSVKRHTHGTESINSTAKQKRIPATHTMCAQLCPPPMLVLGREIMADDSQKKRIPTATYNTGGQSRARLSTFKT